MNKEIIEKIINEINAKFREEHVWADAEYKEPTFSTKYEIEVYVEHGDWKHDHLRAEHIVKNILGNHFRDHFEDVTESDGSDCYSAWHTFSTDITYRDKIVWKLDVGYCCI